MRVLKLLLADENGTVVQAFEVHEVHPDVVVDEDADVPEGADGVFGGDLVDIDELQYALAQAIVREGRKPDPTLVPND